MALVKGENSYVTLDEAEAYFEDRFETSIWDEASSPDKQRALVTASLLFNDIKWVGSIVDESQLLAFPRVGSIYDSNKNLVRDLSVTPMEFSAATCELALHLLTNPDVLGISASAKEIELDGIVLTNISEPPVIPWRIRRMVNSFAVVGDKAVWRAN